MSTDEATAQGSSPLARGLHGEGLVPHGHARIIPARAGFTRPRPEVRSRGRDHPRSRGVYVRTTCDVQCLGGSSPLARGLRCRKSPAAPRQRIIPARAGFTRYTTPRSGTCPDHPRSRGVYTPPGTRPRGVTGSSPLARGLRENERVPRRQHGIIPARAGFTRTASAICSRNWDHPRSRGVYHGLIGHS